MDYLCNGNYNTLMKGIEEEGREQERERDGSRGGRRERGEREDGGRRSLVGGMNIKTSFLL